MRNLTKTILAAGFVVTGGAAMAQAIPFGEIDTDGDGMLSNAELTAAFGADGAAMIMADDANADGMISIMEVRVGMNSMEQEMDSLADPEEDDDDDNMLEDDGTLTDLDGDDDDDGSEGLDDEDN